MGILTEDMKRVVSEQQLGFCATVCPDGSPNLSPKGSTRVWDDDHLFFADICSPRTARASPGCTSAAPALRPRQLRVSWMTGIGRPCRAALRR
jgi:hypothetical protein